MKRKIVLVIGLGIILVLVTLNLAGMREQQARIDVLIDQLSDETREVRERAAEALGKIGEPAKEAIPALLEALGDEAREVRERAAEALGKIGKPAKGAIPVLIEALNDESDRVRESAAEALEKLGYKIRPSMTGIGKEGATFEDGKKHHFRKTHWGMNRKLVKTIETVEYLTEHDNLLFYKGKVHGLVCMISYTFIKNQLVSGTYTFDAEHSHRNQYIKDFEDVKKILTDRYGNPIDDLKDWHNYQYKDDRNEWGLAVGVGHLSYSSLWKTADSEILLRLDGEDYEISHVLKYKSKKAQEAS